MPEDGKGRRCAAVIIAAGGSSRMGEPKQLLKLDGKPMVVRAADAALGSSAFPVAVVMGAEEKAIRASLGNRNVLAVTNPEWASGMASSIRAGLAAVLKADPGIDAVLVAPCDQPALSSVVIEALVALQRHQGGIAAVRFCGRNGAPAVFGRDYFADLARLSGDEGARVLLNGGNARVSSLEMAAFAIDLDTPEDLARWRTAGDPSRNARV